MSKKGKSTTTYVLDTNVLISDPHAMYAFDEHDVLIVDMTLEELDNLKARQDEVGSNARAAVRELNKLREIGSIVDGVKMNETSGKFFVELNHSKEDLPVGWCDNKADHRILRACSAMKKDGKNVVLVSSDNIMRFKADIMGVPAEEYKTLKAQDVSDQYKGRRDIHLKPGGIDEFYSKKHNSIDVDLIFDYDKMSELIVNEFLVMTDVVTGKSALGRYDGQKIVSLKYADAKPYDVVPRNVGQKFAFEALMTSADEAPLVIIKGGAGTAKTFCALAAGLEQVHNNFANSAYREVLIARPNVKFDEDIGYLKGSEMEKISPLLRPIYDNLKALFTLNKSKLDAKAMQAQIDYLFECGYITAEALAYFRGRSIHSCYTIIDESQNMSPIQAFGIITRAGVGSKIILLGDPKQIDNTYLDSKTNGLTYASEKMKGNPLCWQITFDDDECVRSKLAIEAINSMAPKGFRSFRR
jgi:PhoH-like ATPase